MRTALSAVVALSFVGACSPERPPRPQVELSWEAATKEDIAQYSDHAQLCRDYGLDGDCDICRSRNWYGDGECDPFCVKGDEDCQGSHRDGGLGGGPGTGATVPTDAALDVEGGDAMALDAGAPSSNDAGTDSDVDGDGDFHVDSGAHVDGGVTDAAADSGNADAGPSPTVQWVLAPASRNCDYACYLEGMSCDDDLLREHDSEVDTPDEVRELFAAVGAVCNSFGPGQCTPCGGDSRVPYFYAESGHCTHSFERTPSSFSCSAHSAYVQRLCLCVEG